MENINYPSVELNDDINNEPATEEVTPDNEDILLRGLLEAANYKEVEKRKINVNRTDEDGNQITMFSFHIRPLSDEELVQCRNKAMKTRPNRSTRRAGGVQDEINISMFRCWKIYTATTDEDKKRIWENKKIKDALIAQGHTNIITAVDMIEAVFPAGKKDQIDDIIDDISGFGDKSVSLEEYAKN